MDAAETTRRRLRLSPRELLGVAATITTFVGCYVYQLANPARYKYGGLQRLTVATGLMMVLGALAWGVAKIARRRTTERCAVRATVVIVSPIFVGAGLGECVGLYTGCDTRGIVGLALLGGYVGQLIGTVAIVAREFWAPRAQEGPTSEFETPKTPLRVYVLVLAIWLAAAVPLASLIIGPEFFGSARE